MAFIMLRIVATAAQAAGPAESRSAGRSACPTFDSTRAANVKQLRAAMSTKRISIGLAGLWVASTVLPLAAQNANPNAPAAGMRRPGGGAGLDYKAYDAVTLERGKAAFTSNCGFCHGSNARGGESGPDLLRSALVRDDEDGNLIAPVVTNGRPAAGMPKFALPREQVMEIVAFLHEGVRAAAERGTYKVLNVVTGNAKAGEAYFMSVVG